MTKPSDTVVLKLELGDLQPPLSLGDVLQLIAVHRGDDYEFSNEFDVFMECLTRPDDSRAEFSDKLEINEDDVHWDQKTQTGSLRATCEWSSHYGCADMDGYGEEETDISIELNQQNKVLVFKAEKTPEPRSTCDEL